MGWEWAAATGVRAILRRFCQALGATHPAGGTQTRILSFEVSRAADSRSRCTRLLAGF